jgi:hypothetical protein
LPNCTIRRLHRSELAAVGSKSEVDLANADFRFTPDFVVKVGCYRWAVGDFAKSGQL